MTTDPLATDHAPSLTGFPPYETSFIGRDGEVIVVRDALVRAGARLVTLTGPDGIGTSRLGIHAASVVTAEIADAACVVALDAARDPDSAVPTIARALGITETPDQDPVAMIVASLRRKRTLLVLDNVRQGAMPAPLIASLLQAPGVRIIATSRAPLNVAGEHVIRLSPLTLPDLDHLPPGDDLMDVAAIRLFVDRARAVVHDFALTATNARAVAEICAALDGLPLAIELVAAATATATPGAILAGLRERLDGAQAAADETSARERMLRAAITFAHDLLAPRERRLLTDLSVFVGGCTLEAAFVVCTTGDDPAPVVLKRLETLCDRGLLRCTPGRDGEQRFSMVQPILAYAAEQLAARDDEEAMWRRYASYYLTLALQTEHMLRGPEQVRWLERIESEGDNIRAVLRRAFDTGNAALGLRLAAALDRFWQYHAHLTEGRHWLARGLASDETIPMAVRAKALSLAGWLARFQQDMGEAASLLSESLALYRALGDSRGIAEVVDTLGDLAHFGGDQERARALHEENLARRQEIGDRWGMAMSLNSLGWIALAEGDPRRATGLLNRSLAIVRELQDGRGIAMVLNGLGWASLDGGNAGQAHLCMRESLVLFHKLGAKVDICLTLDGIAAAAAMRGDAEQAARLFGAAHAIRDAINVDYAAITDRHYARHREEARARMGEAAWSAAWEAGASLSMDQSIAEALRIAE